MHDLCWSINFIFHMKNFSLTLSAGLPIYFITIFGCKVNTKKYFCDRKPNV